MIDSLQRKIILNQGSIDNNTAKESKSSAPVVDLSPLLRQKFFECFSELSVRAQNVLSKNKINTWDKFSVLLTKDNYSFLQFNHCGKKTEDELKQMAAYLKNFMATATDEKTNTTNGNGVTVSDNNLLLDTQLIHFDLSVRAINCLKSIEIFTLGDLVSLNKKDLFSIRNIGKRTVLELENLVESRNLHFGYIPDERNVNLNDTLSSKLNSLKPLERQFSLYFKERNGHYPMLFLLSTELGRLTEYEREIFTMYYGLLNPQPISSNEILDALNCGKSLYVGERPAPMSIEEIASKFGLTFERIRQILSKAKKRITNLAKTLHDHPDWQFYNMGSIPPIIWRDNMQIDNTLALEESELNKYLFENMSLSEILSYLQVKPFLDKHLYMILLQTWGMTLYWINIPDKEVKMYYSPTCAHKPSFAIDNKIESFKFNKAIKEIERLYKIKTEDDIQIPLDSYFITNSEYWKNMPKLSDSEKYTLRESLIRIFELLCNAQFKDGRLFIPVNKFDFCENLYNILKSAGTRLHRDELYNQLKMIWQKKGLSEDITDPSKITPFLTKDPRIVPVGKSGYWGLKEWGEMIGSIRELSIKLVKQHRRPIHISDLIRLVMEARPDSNEKSVSSVIRQTTASGELLLFYDDYIGNPNAKYVKDFVLMPQSFNEWLKAFKNFVLKNKRYPFSNQDFEGYLYRWHYRTSQLTDLSAEEIVKFDALEKELAHYPHNALEYNFLHNCNLYKKFVEGNNRILKESDDIELFKWFYKSSRDYSNYNDNRNKYFSQLLQFLSSKLY